MKIITKKFIIKSFSYFHIKCKISNSIEIKLPFIVLCCYGKFSLDYQSMNLLVYVQFITKIKFQLIIMLLNKTTLKYRRFLVYKEFKFYTKK